jgi:hypothetical protein
MSRFELSDCAIGEVKGIRARLGARAPALLPEAVSTTSNRPQSKSRSKARGALNMGLIATISLLEERPNRLARNRAKTVDADRALS